MICGVCGAESAAGARFCHGCGSALAEPEPERMRRTVTVLFCDLVGSTSLGEQLDAEVIADVMTEYFDAIRPAIERHGGSVAKFMGDAVLAVFGAPTVHEDDALRAVRAATEVSAVVREFNPRFEERWGITIATRTGINTGRIASVGLVPDQGFVGGDVSNTAARLQSHADENGVLLAETTYRLVREAVVAEELLPLELKGKAEPARVYRLRELLEPGHARPVRPDAPMVGRGSDLDRLRRALGEIEHSRRCGVVTVVGQPGVGKSRLVRELLAEVEDRALIAVGRCPSYGEGNTYWPVAEAVVQACGLAAGDPPERVRAKIRAVVSHAPDAELVVERVAHVVGRSETAAVAEEIAWAVRRLFEELARGRPVVLVIDDIHLAEPTLLALLDHLEDHVHGVALAVVCMARPELLEHEPPWGADRARRVGVVLEPLDDDETELLIGELLGGGLPREALERVVGAAAGNPLFVEHLLAMLVDEGLLEVVDSGLVMADDLSQFRVPPTVQALLAARLERLEPPERRVLGRAAVIGHTFALPALRALLPTELERRVDPVVGRLVTRDLLAAVTGDEGERFAFRHILIRDVAYQALGKALRAELHELHADWLDEVGAGGDELLGHHLEQAYGYRVEVGRADDHCRMLASRATRHLGAATHRALGRGDMPAATGLSARALALIDARDPARARLLVDRGDALQLTGRFTEAAESFEEALSAATAADDRAAAATARVARAWLRPSHDPAARFEDVVGACLPELEVLESAGDAAGAARAARVVMWAQGSLGRFDAAREAAEQAIAHGAEAGDPRLAFDRATLVSCLFYGPTPAPEAEARAEELLAQVRESPAAEANLLVRLGMIRAIQGRIDEGETTVREGATAIAALGLHIVSVVNAALGLGYVHLLRGDWAAAERELRPCFETLEPLGETSFLSGNAARLASALVELERLDEADGFVRVAERTATPDDVFSQVLWRLSRARILASRGLYDDALSLAREAVEQSLATDIPELQGDAVLALARVEAAAGDVEAARASAAAAHERYAAKGHVVSAARAASLGEALRAAATTA